MKNEFLFNHTLTPDERKKYMTMQCIPENQSIDKDMLIEYLSSIIYQCSELLQMINNLDCNYKLQSKKLNKKITNDEEDIRIKIQTDKPNNKPKQQRQSQLYSIEDMIKDINEYKKKQDYYPKRVIPNHNPTDDISLSSDDYNEFVEQLKAEFKSAKENIESNKDKIKINYNKVLTIDPFSKIPSITKSRIKQKVLYLIFNSQFYEVKTSIAYNTIFYVYQLSPEEQKELHTNYTYLFIAERNSNYSVEVMDTELYIFATELDVHIKAISARDTNNDEKYQIFFGV